MNDIVGPSLRAKEIATAIEALLGLRPDILSMGTVPVPGAGVAERHRIAFVLQDGSDFVIEITKRWNRL